MSSNLYKAGWVVLNSDARVINTNELIEKKLQSVLTRQEPKQEAEEREADGDGFLSGLDAQTVDALVLEDSEEAVLKSASIEERDALNAQIEQMRTELQNLKAQADRVLEEANRQAESQRAMIFEEAQSQGYQEGYAQGMAKAQELQDEYKVQKIQLEQEYQTRIEELEPEFIDAITDIYEHIFKVDLSDYHQLVVQLLADTMQKAESSRSYIVHVSKEDYPAVLEQKGLLLEETGTLEERLEIVSDMTLAQGGCMIETQSGIYDCSLGTELEEITRKLKLLSYKKN